MLQDFRDIWKGDTAVIVGNGPSLDQTPLEKLRHISFGSNKIYDSASHPDFKPTYWTCIDREMLAECVPWVLEHPEFNSHKFVPREYQVPGASLLNVVVGRPIAPADEYVVMGGTVTIVNLQLALFMGFTTCLLVGVDNRYPKASVGEPGSKFIADGDDPDHFRSKSGAYFSKGRIYNRPELQALERLTYPAINRWFEKHKAKIVNLTPGTALTTFPCEDWRKWA